MLTLLDIVVFKDTCKVYKLPVVRITFKNIPSTISNIQQVDYSFRSDKYFTKRNTQMPIRPKTNAH